MTPTGFSLNGKIALVTGGVPGLGASYVTGQVLAIDGGYLTHF
ncbi:hypothetical protein [Scytonema sp. UIC 10036]|nr:hypothetical protein [Scytonema sp. UIC 10036]